MGRKPLDSRERANNLIKRFAPDLNQKLIDSPELAKTYTLKQMCTDFSKYLGLKDTYTSSSMLDILKRNGLTWHKTHKRILATSDLVDFDPDDYTVHERLYQTFISVDINAKKQHLKQWLEEEISIRDDILAVISTPKGLLVISHKDYIKGKIKERISSTKKQS